MIPLLLLFTSLNAYTPDWYHQTTIEAFAAFDIKQAVIIDDMPASFKGTQQSHIVTYACTDGKTVWIDREKCDRLTEQLVTFMLYHEAAHVCKRHSQKKRLALDIDIIAQTGLLAAHGYLIYRAVKKEMDFGRGYVAHMSTVLGAQGLIFMVSNHIRNQLNDSYELEADALAAKKLIQSGKVDYVIAWVNHLHKTLRHPGLSKSTKEKFKKEIANIEQIAQPSMMQSKI